jgi:hypothetical protein
MGEREPTFDPAAVVRLTVLMEESVGSPDIVRSPPIIQISLLRTFAAFTHHSVEQV